MNRKLFTSILLTLVLAVVVAPTASPATRGYASGHFELAIDGNVVYRGAGELSTANTLVLHGERTAALVSWARSGELRNAALVEYDGTRVVTYSIVNAWPKLHDEQLTLHFEHIAWD